MQATSLSAFLACDKVNARRRATPRPAHGSARVLARPVCGGALGELLINGARYLCQCNREGYRLCGRVGDDGKPVVYDLPSDLSSCDCPDGTFRPDRPGGCKHAAALRALKAADKLS